MPAEDVLEGAARAGFALAILRGVELLGDPTQVGKLGPSALKATVQAMSAAAEQLRCLGVMLGADGIGRPDELTIHIMGAEETARVQAEVEAAAATINGVTDGDNGGGGEEAGKAPFPGADDAPTAPGASTTHPPASVPANLRERLEALGYRFGAVALRALAVEIGAPVSRDREALVSAIVGYVSEDREALAVVTLRLDRQPD